MLKTLMKKQLQELFYRYRTGKKGKLRSKVMTGFLVLLVLLSLASWFFAIAVQLCRPLTEVGLGWLYFALMGGVGLIVGVFGSVFTTYAGLYVAKDNELLLSMPIPPKTLLLSRMAVLYLSDVVYTGLALVVADIAYWAVVGISAASVVSNVLILFLLPLFSLAVCCVLAGVLAKVVPRMRNKTIGTVIGSLLFLGVIYYFSFRMNTLLTAIAENGAEVGEKVSSYAHLLACMGRAAEGSLLHLLIFAAVCIGVFAVVYALLSRTFLSLVTDRRGAKKAVYRETALKVSSVDQALFRKETHRFFGCAVYLLNAGLGDVFLAVGVIGLVWKSGEIQAILAEFGDGFGGMMTLVCGVIACLIAGMNMVSAPSIALEGNALWILQSMPVTPWQVLSAKLKLHVRVSIVPAAVFCAVGGGLLGGDERTTVLTILAVCLYIRLNGCIGLLMGMKFPNFNWTSEQAAVKQSAAVGLTLLVNWASVAVSALAGAALLAVVPSWVVAAVFAVVYGLVGALLTRRLKHTGSERFYTMSQ